MTEMSGDLASLILTNGIGVDSKEFSTFTFKDMCHSEELRFEGCNHLFTATEKLGKDDLHEPTECLSFVYEVVRNLMCNNNNY